MDNQIQIVNDSQTIEHYEQCKKLSLRKKCKQCFNIYMAKKNKQYRKNKSEKIITTRSVSNNAKPKYASVLCINCKDKRVMDICSQCKTKYKSAKKANQRANKRTQKVNHLHSHPTQSTDICQVLSNGKQRQESELVSNIVLKSVSHVAKKRKIQTSNSLKSKSKVVNEYDILKEQMNQVQPSSVLNSVHEVTNESIYCEQSNHTNQPNISENLILTNENHSANDKENLDCANVSDLDNIKTPKKVLCEKTLRNNTSMMNKVLGSSPNRAMQKLEHFAEHSPLSVKKMLAKKFNPAIEDEVKGNLYKSMRKERPKSDESYDTLSKLSTGMKFKNVTDIKNIFGVCHEKAMEIHSKRKTSRKKRRNKLTKKK